MKMSIEEARSRQAIRTNEWRAKLSPQQQIEQAQKQKDRRAKMTPEERDEYNAKARSYRANQTPEQKAHKAAYQKAYFANLTEEQREERRRKSKKVNEAKNFEKRVARLAHFAERKLTAKKRIAENARQRKFAMTDEQKIARKLYEHNRAIDTAVRAKKEEQRKIGISHTKPRPLSTEKCF